MLIQANDSGLVTRQETVSMLEAKVLQLKKGQLVLDMCAAPGSKTGQMLELLGVEGGVVANEPSTDRGSMLIHQLNRIGVASGAVVISHQG